MFVIFLLVFACILWPEVTSFSFWIVVSLIVMAFQGAGQAQQLTPAAVEPVPAFLEKSFVDFYPTCDKTKKVVEYHWVDDDLRGLLSE